MDHKFPTPDGQFATRCIFCGVHIMSDQAEMPCPTGSINPVHVHHNLANSDSPAKRGVYDVRGVALPTIADALRQVAKDIDTGELEITGRPLVIVLR